MSAGVETAWPAALATALSGRIPQASQLATAFQERSPPAPDVVGAQVPMLQGAIALAAHDARRALAILDGALPFDRPAGPWLPYLRGLAHEALQDHRQAADAFRAIVTHRGNQPANIVHTVAHLQLARALRAAGDADGAHEAYADFAAAWRSADPRHPLGVAAAREAAALPAPASR